MPEPLETIAAFVDAFVAAWPTGEADVLGRYFTEDAVYHNGPLAPVVGRAAIVATIESFMGMGGTVTVDMVHALAVGPLVMTERVDYFVADGRTFALPVAGVFELNGGQIAAWRDYFDLGGFTSQLTPEA
jgi:limonene-1,2-epoxide hydrolase